MTSMSKNLYSYCGNNPINYIDPTGHFYYGVNGQKSSIQYYKYLNYSPYLKTYKDIVRVRFQLKKKSPKYSIEEKALIANYPLSAVLINGNHKDTLEMVDYINEKYELGMPLGTNRDGTALNAFQHAFFAFLNGKDVGTRFAQYFSDARENKYNNDYSNTVMDLHNNAIGLYLSTLPEAFWKDMAMEEMADYVYNIILEDGYWIRDGGNIPGWAEAK